MQCALHTHTIRWSQDGPFFGSLKCKEEFIGGSLPALATNKKESHTAVRNYMMTIIQDRVKSVPSAFEHATEKFYTNLRANGEGLGREGYSRNSASPAGLPRFTCCILLCVHTVCTHTPSCRSILLPKACRSVRALEPALPPLENATHTLYGISASTGSSHPRVELCINKPRGRSNDARNWICCCS